MNTMNRPRKTVRRVGWDGKLLLASVDEVKYFSLILLNFFGLNWDSFGSIF